MYRLARLLALTAALVRDDDISNEAGQHVMFRLKFSAFAVAILSVAVAVPVASARSASPPGNLCTLHVKKQLKALPLGSTACKVGNTVHIRGLTIESANWGTLDHAIALQIFVNLPKDRFMKQVDTHAQKIKIGDAFGWEDAGPSGVGLSVWVNGMGVMVLLHTPLATTKANRPYEVPVGAFTYAVMRQI